MKTLKPLKFFAAVTLATLPASAGELTIVQKQGAPATGSTSVAYYGTTAFKHADGQTESIFEYASGKLTVIEPARKQYWEATAEDMQAALDAMNKKMAEALKQLEQVKGNPMLETMMKNMPGMGGPAGPVQVTKTAQTRRIAGYDCTKYVIAMGEGLTIETWVTAALKPPVGALRARQAFASANPMLQRYVKAFEELTKIDGLSLAESTSFEMMGRKTAVSNEATEVREGAIAASVFATPAGYKRVESPLKKLAQEMDR